MRDATIGEGEGAFAKGTIGLVVVAPCGRIVRTNATFREATGIAPEAISNANLGQVFDASVDVDALLAILGRFELGGAIVPSRSVPFLRRLAGKGERAVERRHAEVSLLERFDGGDAGDARLVLSFVDISDAHTGTHTDTSVRSAETRYKDIYENIVEGVYRSSLEGVQLSANPALVALNGYDSEAEMLAAVNDIAAEWYVDPTSRDAFQDILQRQGFVRDFVAEIYRHKTRERIWISENARLVRDPSTGEPLCYEGSIRDVTAMVELLAEKAKLDKIAAQAPGCLFEARLIPGGALAMSYASAGIETMLGVLPGEVVEDLRAFERRVHPDDRAALTETMATSAQNLAPWRTEFRMRRADGIDIWIGGHALPEAEADGTVVWYGFLSDVTQSRLARERMENLAFTDGLTGLPNRQMLRDRARQELAASDRSGEWGAILFLDLDGFKALNDRHGHDAGDQLLIAVARRLESVLRANDVVARLGGDEFVVLLTHLSRDAPAAADNAGKVAEKVRAAIDAPYELGPCTFQTSSSVGMEMFQGRDIDFDALLKRADTAMYQAKSGGKNRVCRYRPALRAALQPAAATAQDVRAAIEGGQMALWVQPIVEAGGEVRGGEALLRWMHPKHGPTSPVELLEKAEAMGLSGRLHHWVTTRACEMLAAWQGDPAMQGLTLSMNVAPAQVQHAGFAHELIDLLDASGAPADRLMLEVTDHAMLGDVGALAAMLRRLKRRGLRFSLDDFGTGYASLTHLKSLPLNELKIDRSFVADLEGDTDANVIVGTTILAARQLGLSVTGVGVETAGQAAALRALGADRFQGYLFARAMPEPEFRLFVAGNRTPERVRKVG